MKLAITPRLSLWLLALLGSPMVAVALTPDGVSIAAATVYSTATGSTAIGSIGVDENVDIGTTSGRTFITYRTSGADKSGWVAASSVVFTSWRWPVEAVRTTQDFNAYSASRNGYHLAKDITGLVGDDNIRVPYAGVVKTRSFSNGNGNHVILEHTNTSGTKIYSLYSHLLSFGSSIVVGATVAKGTLIGVMGCTGSCTGKHLHFSLYHRHYSSDPYGYTSSSGTVISRSNSKIVMSYSSGTVTYWDPEYVIRNSGATPP